MRAAVGATVLRHYYFPHIDAQQRPGISRYYSLPRSLALRTRRSNTFSLPPLQCRVVVVVVVVHSPQRLVCGNYLDFAFRVSNNDSIRVCGGRPFCASHPLTTLEETGSRLVTSYNRTWVTPCWRLGTLLMLDLVSAIASRIIYC